MEKTQKKRPKLTLDVPEEEEQERKISTLKSGYLIEPKNGDIKGSLIWLHGLGDTANVSESI